MPQQLSIVQKHPNRDYQKTEQENHNLYQRALTVEGPVRNRKKKRLEFIPEILKKALQRLGWDL